MKTFGLISTASLFAFMSIAAFGQSEAAPETFESVSVTLSTTQSPARAGVRIQGERVTGNRLTLEELLVFAHGVQRSQISGPNWISTERFDLVAKTETPVTYPRLRKMLQVLLEDLFKLMSHRETRAVPVYWLVVAEGGPKLGGRKEQEAFTAAFADKSPFSLAWQDCIRTRTCPSLPRSWGAHRDSIVPCWTGPESKVSIGSSLSGRPDPTVLERRLSSPHFPNNWG